MPKQVAFLTGKLGGHSALTPLFTLFQADDRFSPYWIACDQSVSDTFGNTASLLPGDVDRVEVERFPTSPARTVGDRNELCARAQVEIGEQLNGRRPSALILFGDRGETLAGAVAAAQLGIPIAHLQAGDTTGGIDNLWRHAITTMSRWAFTSCTQSQLRAGFCIPQAACYLVGDLHIDPLPAAQGPKEGTGEVIVHVHPETLSPIQPRDQVEAVKQALYSIGHDRMNPLTWLHPCSDPGWQEVAEQAGTISKVTKYIPPEKYLSLLAGADLLIGNSSSGIIETPYLGTPSVDIGSRQKGRTRCPGTFHCASWDAGAIAQTIEQALEFSEFLPWDQLPYGIGGASWRVYDILSEELSHE